MVEHLVFLHGTPYFWAEGILFKTVETHMTFIC